MTIIYLTRHTKPDKTKYKKSSNELEQNKTIELSEEGKIKAQKFFKKQEFKTIEKIYTSDYIRAQETGLPLYLGNPFHIFSRAAN